MSLKADYQLQKLNPLELYPTGPPNIFLTGSPKKRFFVGPVGFM